MSKASLTPHRKQALLLLARHGSMRMSNQTTDATLHWKPASWLIQHGLAETQRPGGEFIALTDAGRDIAAAVRS